MHNCQLGAGSQCDISQRPEYLQPVVCCIATMVKAKFWQIGQPVIWISPIASIILITRRFLLALLLLLLLWRGHILLNFQKLIHHRVQDNGIISDYLS